MNDAVNNDVPVIERRVERIIGRLLQVGVLASLALLAGGTVLSFVPDQQPLAEQIQRAGLYLLIATPVARVIVSIVAFAFERDWAFVMITTIVLALLGLSLGLGGHR